MQVYNMRQYCASYHVSQHAIIQFQKRIATTYSFKDAERELLELLPGPEDLSRYKSTGSDPHEYEIPSTRWGTFTAIIRQAAEITQDAWWVVVTIYRSVARGYSAECTLCGRLYKKDFRPGMEHKRPLCSSRCIYLFKQKRHGKFRRTK